jgi:hypothetical protein
MVEGLSLMRITDSMTHAAKHRQLYHLWWHPHNFGVHQSQNFSFLQKILEHYLFLNKKYGFTSITMSKMANLVMGKRLRTALKENTS